VTYLLDTHVLLWWLFGDRHLSRRATDLIADSSNRILVSSASAWEISIKHHLGKLSGADPIVRDLGEWMTKAGFEELPIFIGHAQKAGAWPQDHKDPFDRMLAAQSVIEDVPLISSDRALRTFGIQLLW
jgi:PIN domain nuclease of toxin-antitoxin system